MSLAREVLSAAIRNGPKVVDVAGELRDLRRAVAQLIAEVLSERLYEARVVDLPTAATIVRVVGPAAVRFIASQVDILTVWDQENVPASSSALPLEARRFVGTLYEGPPIIFRRGVIVKATLPAATETVTIIYRGLTPAEIAADKDELT